MLKQIIFHADDFNLSPGVNRGIFEAHRVGVVKSTSIMINLPGIDESVKQLKQMPKLDIGLHVNLTYGTPILERDEVPSLVDDGGIFWRKPDLLVEYADPADLRKEIIAQINLAQKMGIKLTHLDSHHHIHHRDSRVNEVLMNLAERLHLAIRSLDDKDRQLYRSRGIPTTDHYTDDFYGDKNINFEMLEKVIKNLPDGVSEIMCHPGFSDGDLLNKSSYDNPREMEVRILTHPKTLQLIQQEQARIIGYQEILEFSPGFIDKSRIK